MRLGTPLNSNSTLRIFLILTIAWWLITCLGCSDVVIKDPPVQGPMERAFSDSYDHVWRAVQLALRKYPVQSNIFDSGTLETYYIKSDKLFSDPNDVKSPAGLRYKLTVRAVKGRINNNPVVKVSINKSAEVQSDFFSGYQPIDSDGLEENVLLYRIGRYLEMK